MHIPVTNASINRLSKGNIEEAAYLFPQEKSGYQIGTRGDLHQLCDSAPRVLSLALLRRLDLSGHDRTPRVL
jgi:hypothetical protein